MKKFFLRLLCIAGTLAAAVSCFDDSTIMEKLDDFEGRISALEDAVKTLNTNVVNLQTLVMALQNNDYVTSVTPVVENGKTVGYTINFTKSQPITIKHGIDGSNGANGKDGYTPAIGVNKDSDGNWYWTVDGSWLLDAQGNKIRANGIDGANGADGQNGANGENGANGADGKDGVTPKFKIEDGYWFVSYDNGETWSEPLGKAQGDKGEDGGDSVFESINVTDEAVTFLLKDGTEIVIPRIPTFKLVCEGNDALAGSEGAYISYEVLGASEDDDVVVYIAHVSAGWVAELYADTPLTGGVAVLGPEDEGTGLVVLQAVNNTTGAVSGQAIRLYNGEISITGGAYKPVGCEGGEITVPITTNFAEVTIECSAEWVYLKPQTKGFTTTEYVFVVEPNKGEARSAMITISGPEVYGEEGQIVIQIDQDEYSVTPLYTAIATFSHDEDYEASSYAAFPLTKDVTVEAYDGYVILKGWSGVEGRDLIVEFNEDEEVIGLTPITDGVVGTKYTSDYAYLYPGLPDFDEYVTPCLSYGTYRYCSATSNAEEEYGYVSLDMYNIYYYITWGELPDDGVIVNGFTMDLGDLGDAYEGIECPAYMVDGSITAQVGDNYIYVYNFNGVEGYDLYVEYDDDPEENFDYIITSAYVCHDGVYSDLSEDFVDCGTEKWMSDDVIGEFFNQVAINEDWGAMLYVANIQVGEEVKNVYYYLAWGDAATPYSVKRK